MIGLFIVYKFVRLLILGRVDTAFDNAWEIWDLQRALDLPNEAALQHALLDKELLLRASNSYYAYVHFPATGVFLVWVYLRRPMYYLWTRRIIAGLTAAALGGHILMPLAPPRMLTGTGMVDTGRLVGPAVYGDAGTSTLSNQYAAMPSLHVGWALAIAVVLITVTRTRWRWAWLLHPLITVFVVVITGNHYWLDGIAAAGILAVVLLYCPWPGKEPHRFFGRSVRPPEPAVTVEQSM